MMDPSLHHSLTYAKSQLKNKRVYYKCSCVLVVVSFPGCVVGVAEDPLAAAERAGEAVAGGHAHEAAVRDRERRRGGQQRAQGGGGHAGHQQGQLRGSPGLL